MNLIFIDIDVNIFKISLTITEMVQQKLPTSSRESYCINESNLMRRFKQSIDGSIGT